MGEFGSLMVWGWYFMSNDDISSHKLREGLHLDPRGKGKFLLSLGIQEVVMSWCWPRGVEAHSVICCVTYARITMNV